MNQDIMADRHLYRIHDPGVEKGCFPVADISEALSWNEKQWGIFWTVNKFKNPGERVAASLDRILCWAVDLDTGTKAEQLQTIAKFAEPSALIETKNGHHVYYDAIDPTTKAFPEIMGRLVENLNADPNAKDLSRILRVPAFCHWKDPKNPFAIKLVHESNRVYTEKDMLILFPELKKKTNDEVEMQTLKRTLSFQKDDTLFDKIYGLDCEAALMRLSGTIAVDYETFSFRRVSRGNVNILVNNKSTSCFIDPNKRIGGGGGTAGPTIWQWVNYYHRDHQKTYGYIKTYLPELFCE
ncbi:MAG TPA: hypothetical protein PLU50_04630 [Pseudobdellovibrionaceae bacterium]|nr:hypothetical protein [Anaerolineales bacterium]HND85067.1 hypothetical protein [Pseudobdellovibrionaceae bacterium]